ncbi:hypothetical protein D3C75_610210 [compost metagenome]
MTPERKEEIKQSWAYRMSELAHELMAALEEAEQQKEMWKRKYEGSVQIGDANYDAEQKALAELAEAQQTIARQLDALERIMDVTGADYEESFNKAIHIAYLELGLGEGDEES